VTIARSTRVFFDASCLIAAAGSPFGGSGYVLLLSRAGLFVPVVSQLVLVETERNIRENLPPAALERYHETLASTPLVLAAAADLERLVACRDIAGEKDAHVLGSAEGCAYLLTLDKRLAVAVNREPRSVEALAPGEFITRVLPTHDEYSP
jgi:predicted nucleic acid-binding protein